MSEAAAPRLLIAPAGMLGAAVARALDDGGLPARRAGRPELDITDPDSVARHVRDGTEVVFNCAAYTDVDGAESDEAAAFEVNAAGVAQLARRCADVGALLVHYSTDYVFNGRASRPYRVAEPRDPVNAYGRSKAAGEAALEASGAEFLLLRTSWVYAPWGNNFVRTMAKLGATRDQLRVVNDQRGRPTSAEHLAAVTLALVQRGARGTFHVTDGGEATWYDLASEVVAAVNPACRVDPCASDEFPRPAPRPSYSVLDISETEKLVGPMPLWRDNVAAVLARIRAGEPAC